MKYALYDILLHISGVILLPYFIFKMISSGKYREGIGERFGFVKDDKLQGLSGGPVIWIHAVSVGETKAAIPVLRLFRQRNPSAKVVFSTTTRTGQLTAKEAGRGLVEAFIYFPLDLSWSIKRVIRKVNPSLFMVVEKEVWPNTFRALNKKGVPIIVANGTISDRSFKRFERYGFFFRGVFGMIDYFCARADVDRGRAVKAGVKKDRAKTFGNLKFDIQPGGIGGASLASLRKALGIKESDRVLVAGSTHPGEEEIILETFKELLTKRLKIKLILAPRQPERFNEVETLVKKSGLSYSRRSKGAAGEEDVVILDTVGELLTVYNFATVALVGGSLVEGIGGHNLLEPALFGKPVVYGPYLTSYVSMAEMLEAEGGSIRAKDKKSLFNALKNLFTDDNLRTIMGRAGIKVVESNRGAAKKTVEIMERFLKR